MTEDIIAWVQTLEIGLFHEFKEMECNEVDNSVWYQAKVITPTSMYSCLI